jgi:hypothetical protein
MRLLHWKKLVDLQRIPRSDERESVDAISGIDDFGAPDVEVFMVSHRWLRPSIDRTQAHPDGVGNEKAKTINEFSLWRREWVLKRHRFLPEIYYWIDFCCMDQSNTEGAVPMLPLWIACCERFLRIETVDYEERTWCRVEPLLSYVFSFADHHVSIGLDFRFKWPYTGVRAEAAILDPCTGKTTCPEDMGLIRPLVELAIQAPPASSGRTNLRFGETTMKCFRL